MKVLALTLLLLVGSHLAKANDIYIISQTWHTGILLPSRDLISILPDLHEQLKDTEFVEIGWGDKQVYQAKSVTFSMTAKALLLPTTSTMYISGIDSFNSGHTLTHLGLTNAQYQKLLEFIANSFARDEHGHIIVDKKTQSSQSAFYKAKGKYYAFKTCNSWTAEALRSIGITSSTATTVGDIEFILRQYQSGEYFSPQDEYGPQS